MTITVYDRVDISEFSLIQTNLDTAAFLSMRQSWTPADFFPEGAKPATSNKQQMTSHFSNSQGKGQVPPCRPSAFAQADSSACRI